MSNNAPAALSGDYVDLKFIKSRKVAQVVIEIPLEAAAAFVADFGAPDPSTGVPVAIARLVKQKASGAGGIAQAADVIKRKFRDLPLSQQAAMRCNELSFRRFICKAHEPLLSANDPDDAANSVREWCGVKSRRDLDKGGAPAQKWGRMNEEYELWMRVIE